MECDLAKYSPFHRSADGCVVDVDTETNQQYHVFKATSTSLTKTGLSLLIDSRLGLQNQIFTFLGYNIEMPLNGHKARVRAGPMPPNWSEECSTKDGSLYQRTYTPLQVLNKSSCRDFFSFYFKEYVSQTFELNKLATDATVSETPIFLNVKNFFDFLIYDDAGRFMTLWLRPCYYLTNIETVAGDWQEVLLKLFVNMESHEPPSTTTPLLSLKKNKRATVRKCSVATFLNRLPVHLKCNRPAGSNARCIHFTLCGINELNDKKRTYDWYEKKAFDKTFFKYCCNNVLVFLNNNLSVHQMNTLLDYKCKLNQRHVKRFSRETNTRCDTLHTTLCCPEQLINPRYMLTLCNLLIKTPGPKNTPQPEYERYVRMLEPFLQERSVVDDLLV
ncbi:hypothetical protein CCFV1_ORF007 [Cotesia congregata filamentous virus 1]|uniref:Uncharacterized protein n=1 Tax=Cotesia congregata filamentous virus 1 TaxID=3064291 RepID=A0ABC8QJH8_9VIRU|nr:hypothetical protein CCFV1_ORF007 [Cotesia congregata filamentous virus 1]